MNIKELKDKKGKNLTTHEGVKLIELKLEIGDEFIPLYNTIFEKKRDVLDDTGNKKVFRNYSIKARVKEQDGTLLVINGSDEVFINLTPAQANSIKKKIDAGIEINQHKFIAYEYESEEYGKQIGVGIKNSNKPAKSFDEFEED